MGMATCRHCRKAFTDWYDWCPHCRQPQLWLPVNLIFVGGGFIVGVLALTVGIIWKLIVWFDAW
jgi:hypothetical protein